MKKLRTEEWMWWELFDFKYMNEWITISRKRKKQPLIKAELYTGSKYEYDAGKERRKKARKKCGTREYKDGWDWEGSFFINGRRNQN